MKRLARILFAAAVIGIGGFAMLAWLVHRIGEVEVGFHVAHHRGLPDDASDISYRQELLRDIYAFKISEAGFNAWARSRGFLDARSAGPQGHHVESTPHHLRFRFDEAHVVDIDIADGIWLEKRDRSGAGYMAAFDRSTGMGYYEESAN
jgi:hypothetical protein